MTATARMNGIRLLSRRGAAIFTSGKVGSKVCVQKDCEPPRDCRLPKDRTFSLRGFAVLEGAR